jgi:hypothetical protein
LSREVPQLAAHDLILAAMVLGWRRGRHGRAAGTRIVAGALAAVAGTLALSLLWPGSALARPTTPVVLVVFDEMPTESLLGRRGGVDHIRYPNFGAFAQRSTWYSNATTVSDATKFAIPAILDGRAPKRNVSPTSAGHPKNLFTLLHRQRYRLEVEEEATDLCPYNNCRRRFSARYYLARDRITRFRAWVERIRPTAQPTLYYKHSLLPHTPWIYLPSGQRFDRTVLGPIKGLNSSELSVFDPTLVRQSWQRHLLQVGAADKLLGELIARLKETRLYDKSMIVVMSDHGVSFRDRATDRRTIVRANARDVAPIALFVKYPNQRGPRKDGGLVRSYDVLPTIASKIGLKLPRGIDGKQASSRAVDRRRRVKILSRSKHGAITIDRGKLRRLKRQALRRKVRLFGSGRRTLYDFGPNRRLRGRPLKFPTAEGGSLKATLNESTEYDRIRLDAEFLPIHLTGQITGGPSGVRRDVVVAINGFIRGVTRSVRIRRRKGEYFSVFVSPEALRKGRNEIQVFAVSRTRAGYGLRRLYRSPAPKPPKKPTYPTP